MKKLFLLIFFLLAALSLASCDFGDNPPCEHRDADDNSLCDECGESYSDGDEPAPCGHRDADDNSLCDKCGESYTDGDESAPCEHRDADDNSLCDKCGEGYSDGDEPAEAVSYTVNFMTGTSETLKPVKVKHGEKITLADLERLGFTFVGWFYRSGTEEIEFTADSVVTEELWLIAKWDKNYVTYEDFGAVGDGETNDFLAIYNTHIYANENGLPVKAKNGAVYYISDTHINGNVCSIPIKTDTAWGTAEFYIDDSQINYLTDPDVATNDIFTIQKTTSYSINDAAKLSALGSIKTTTKSLPINIGHDAVVIIADKSHKVFRRWGTGYSVSNRTGQNQTDVLLVNSDGTISDKSPITYDYKKCTSAAVYKIDTEPLTVSGGIFTTVACSLDAKSPGGNFKTYRRGIYVTRSNTTLDGVKHYVVGEVSKEAYNAGIEGVDYRGFFYIQYAANVTMRDCVITGRRYYGTATYDLCAHTVVNLLLDGVKQSNFFVNADGTPSDTYTGYSSMTSNLCWGIMGTNFSKTVTVKNSSLSRYDSHCGLYNGSIENSKINRIQLTGTGSFKIVDTEFYAPGTSKTNSSLIYLRPDYGSTWDGDIEIKNVTARLRGTDMYLLYHVYRNWYFGYETHVPNLTVDNLNVLTLSGEAARGFEIRLMTDNSFVGEDSMHLPTTSATHPIRDPEAFVEDTGSYENLNPVVPPASISIKNNTKGYKFVVPRSDFFSKTKFITENGEQVGTAGASFNDFVFKEISVY